MYKIAAPLALLLSLIPAPALSMEDTPTNRQLQAERYIAAVPPEDMLQDITDKMTAQMPEKRREKFKAGMIKNISVKTLAKTMTDAMAKHFTADELAALADFFSSPIAKSAMKKLSAYSAEITPAVQTELAAAAQKTNAELGP